MSAVSAYVKSHAKAVVAALVAVVSTYVLTHQLDAAAVVAVLSAAGVHITPNASA